MPNLPLSKAGDETNGFSIDYEESIRTLRVRLWGFWEQALSELFLDSLPENPQAQSCEALIVDILNFKPQRESGQEALRRLVSWRATLKIAHAAAITNNILSKMQFSRIVRENKAGVWSYHDSEHGALKQQPQPAQSGLLSQTK